MAEYVTPSFGVYSNYNELAGIEIVRFGANAQVLESELNELQQIADTRSGLVMNKLYSDGLLNLNAITYTQGASSNTLSIAGTYALIGGHLIYISSLTASAQSSATASFYIDTWLQEIAGSTATVKKYGNQQETETIATTAWFKPTGQITSERMQRQFTLIASATTPSTSGHIYLKIGDVAGGAFTRTVSAIKSKVSTLKTAQSFSGDGSTRAFTLSGSYAVGTGQLEVYVSGARVTIGSSCYSETSSTSFTFTSAPPNGAEILVIY